MNELALFAGAGGGILGGHLLGWRCVCAVEYNAYARSILLARQNDGTLAPFPVWDDVRTFDGSPWAGRVDVVSGGFPCQDISVAGKGDGLDGERSGLWVEMARIIRQVGPRFVWVENSPMLLSRGLGRVLGDLAEMGFDAKWGIVSAGDTGAPHRRERIWICAWADGEAEPSGPDANGQRSHHPALHEQAVATELRDQQECEPGSVRGNVAHAHGFAGHQRRVGDTDQGARGRDADRSGERADVADASGDHEQGQFAGLADAQERRGQVQRPAGSRRHGFGRWPAEPGVGRVANGLAHRVDRLKATGNGQVPRVVVAAWPLLSEAV